MKRLTWDDATFAVPALMKARKADVYLKVTYARKSMGDSRRGRPHRLHELAGANVTAESF